MTSAASCASPVPAVAGQSRRPSLPRALALAALLALLPPLLGPTPTSAAGKGQWYLRYTDDFQGGGLLTSRWGVYHATTPGGRYHGGFWDKAAVSVGDGELVLRSSRRADGAWTVGGVSNARGLRQTYGTYEVRARFDRGRGVKAIALLWPAVGWPPEVDFLETRGSDDSRTRNYVSSHHDGGIAQGSYPVDMTEWHTYGVEWSPGRLAYTLDGSVVRSETENVPDQPMWLGIQTQLGSCALSACPNHLTPEHIDLRIDWVRVHGWRL